LGIENGRECLSWLPGVVRHDWLDQPARLDNLARIIRRFHDLTVGDAFGAECLVHDDLQPRNVVVDDDGTLGIVDWEQLRPGRRVEDVSQMCWSFSPPRDADVVSIGRRWRRVLDAYGAVDRVGVVPASLAKIEQCIDDIVRRSAEGSVQHAMFKARGDHLELAGIHTWLTANQTALTAELASATV
jgi:hypothetical protein